MDISKIKQTVRDLLNLANNPGAAVGEIDNAVRFASKLMNEHQLTEEDLAEKGEVDVLLELERAEFVRQSVSLGSSKNSVWEISAAWFACKLVGGVKFYMTSRELARDPETFAVIMDANGNTEYRPAYTFYGVAEDVELAKQVFAELLVTVAAMARIKWGGVYRGPGRDYCEGFIQGLTSKLDATKRAEAAKLEYNPQTGTTGTALVVVARTAIVERKKVLADAWLKGTLGVKLGRGGSRPGSGRRSYNGEARRDGVSDGKRHNATADRRRKLT